MGAATTAALEVVLSPTLIGPFEFEEKAIGGVTSGQQLMEWSALPFF